MPNNQQPEALQGIIAQWHVAHVRSEEVWRQNMAKAFYQTPFHWMIGWLEAANMTQSLS